MPERSEDEDEVARLRDELAYWKRRCEVAERRASEWVLRCVEAMQVNAQHCSRRCQMEMNVDETKAGLTM